MKKLLIIALLGSVWFASSCKKDQPKPEDPIKLKKTASVEDGDDYGDEVDDPYGPVNKDKPKKPKPIRPGDGQHYGSHSNAAGVDCPGPNTCNPPK